MKFFLGYAESANYAGYGEWYIVKASDVDQAHSLITEEAESYYYEQDNDALREDADSFGFDSEDGFEGPYASVIKVFELDLDSLKTFDKVDSLKWLTKPGLGNSYTCIDCFEEEVIEAAKKIQLETVS